MNLNLGSGGRHLGNHINIDIRPQFEPDIVADVCNLPLPNGIAHIVRLDAAYEHIYPHRRAGALREWHRVLRPAGKLVINWIPDFESLLELYGGPAPVSFLPCFGIEMARRMCNGAVALDEPGLHKDVFTAQKVEGELSRAGFLSIHITRPIAEGESLAYNICVEALKP